MTRRKGAKNDLPSMGRAWAARLLTLAHMWLLARGAFVAAAHRRTLQQIAAQKPCTKLPTPSPQLLAQNLPNRPTHQTRNSESMPLQQGNPPTQHLLGPEKKQIHPEERIKQWLISEVKGVGPKLADAIVEEYGERTKEVLLGNTEEPDDMIITKINRLTGKVLDNIRRSIQNCGNQQQRSETLEFCESLGLPYESCLKVWDALAHKAESVILKDPWILRTHLPHLSFDVLDSIAESLNAPPTAMGRCESAVLTIFARAASKGHCFLEMDDLVMQTQRILTCKLLPAPKARKRAKEAIKKLCKDATLHAEKDVPGSSKVHVYTMEARREEEWVALQLRKRMPSEVSPMPNTIELGALARLAGMENESPEELSDGQWKAVLLAAAQSYSIDKGGVDMFGRVMLLTGGPGTGKTHTVRRIVEQWRRHGRRIMLACPTARAAAVLSSAVKHSASTIHRLLEYNPQDDVYSRNGRNPLDADAVVIDEASMLDVSLAANFLHALPANSVVIFVGDPYQLPSVGPGAVLHDMIRSPRLPRIELEQIFRQDPAGDIARNAALIRTGYLPTHWRTMDAQSLHVESVMLSAMNNSNELPSGCIFVPAASDEETSKVIRGPLLRWLKATGYDLDKDVQVLSPQKSGHSGTIKLNSLLRNELNPTDRVISGANLEEDGLGEEDEDEDLAAVGSLPLGSQSSRSKRSDLPLVGVGDPIIQLKNDYDNKVFNGDIGRVIRIRGTTNGFFTFSVLFENRQIGVAGEHSAVQVEYKNSAIGRTVLLAYSLTVHKSQGSEYPVVIMPVIQEHSYMLYRNLVYTGFSRAKRLLIAVGQWRSVGDAVQNVKPIRRNTLLHERLAVDSFAPPVTQGIKELEF